MKIHQLRVLVACAEHSSLRAAADSLALSHPAVTKTIRELENQIGVPLLVRSSRGIELTQYGQALLPRARQILEDMRRANDEIQQLKSGATGKVSIGFTASIALAVIPKALQLFREKMPLVEIELIELPLEYVSAHLLDGSLDFFVTNMHCEIDPECEQILLRQGSLFAAVKKGHPSAQCNSLRQLLGYEWLIPKPNVSQQRFGALFTNYGIAIPERIIAVNSPILAMALLAESNVIGLFTLPYVMHPIIAERIDVLELDEPLFEVSVSILTRRGVQQTPASQLFLNIVREVIETLQWA
ncbi:LysR family transcriptional regulator [Glaciimonas soli]|uniref:LysR family transcriptional regulator n=1 Tax=Glaciimonas soli TaxID=2590999 RepID=A0A843YNY3_9BURK|nr:LysR substrate-binding domain-containing protein [Glaciimonas soli]MQQ99696.1 LysR family transcriptional regulator [Glaciimonas soli]